MSRLRSFQKQLQQGCYDEWGNGKRNVSPVSATGSGKTVLMSVTAREYQGYGVTAAHRSELVSQISMALAQEEMRHDIVASKATIKAIVAAQVEEYGRSYYDPRATWKVASVDTIIRREFPDSWLRQVGMVQQDEGHHALKSNKWGRVFDMFPNAYGMLPTATPERADGKGLGRHADGIMDALVIGPNMRWLIDNGYLTDYRIIAPQASDLSLIGIDVTAGGDYNQGQLRKRVKESHIVGDVVRTYIEWAMGKLGITFAVDVEHATQIADEFNRNGVPAVVVTADTPDADRIKYMRMFKNRELWQLVNVDLFGEGVDVPAIEVCSFARPTKSYGLYVQQFGRVLRLMVGKVLAGAWDTYTVAQRKQFIAESGKPFGLIIDHVGNVVTHNGPPDWRTEPWSLDGANKRSRQLNDRPLRSCCNPTCLQPFERMYPACPHCGWEPPLPADRSRPEHVDGDLVLYTPELMEELFGKRGKVDGPCYVPQGLDPAAAGAIRKRHKERQDAQGELRQTMALVMPPNVDERISQRRFFHTYGVDTLTAQTLGSADAANLRQRILDKVTS